jgi:hypothetical protein
VGGIGDGNASTRLRLLALLSGRQERHQYGQ